MTRIRTGAWLAAIAMLVANLAAAQTLYKYRGDDGEWIFSDRPPPDGEAEETRELARGPANGSLEVASTMVDRTLEIVAHNRFFAPLEVILEFDRISGVAYPDPDDDLHWVLPPRSENNLLSLPLLGTGAVPDVQYRQRATLGDPEARHDNVLYRAPFAISSNYPITQAYPDVNTHNTPDSYHAVDISMPIGTDIFAARGGVVIDVAGNNFRAGVDRERDGPAANVVRILHDDGTYAIYAHLNWNSIRVQPGDRVERGEYIADSGNTGFSTGPHLHFAVIRNRGMYSESVPVRFAGPNGSGVVPARGDALTAH